MPSRPSVSRPAFTLLAFILLTAPLGAQTVSADPDLRTPISNLPAPTDAAVTRLSPLVVTTSASTDRPLETRLDPKAPAQPVPAHDGADVLKAVPGFSVIRKGGTDGDPVLRGFAGSRLGVQIDGQCIFGGCGNRMDPPTAYVFPAAYDRITVIKGPQSVLHGPGNSAGVVLFERNLTRYTTPAASLFASGTAGSFGRLDGAVDTAAGNPAVQARAALTSTRADDYHDGNGRSVHSAYERWSANAAAAWTPDDRTFVEFSAAASDGEAADADRTMDGVKFARDNVAFRAARTSLTPLVDRLELRAYRNYVDHVMDNFSLRPFVATPTMPGRAVSNPDRLTTGAVAELVLTPLDATRLTLGLDTQRNVHTLRSTGDDPTAPYRAKARVRDARFQQAGAFAEVAHTLAPGRRLYAGARLDQWETTDSRSAVAVTMMSTAPNPTAGHTRASDLCSGFVRAEQDVGAATAPVTLFAGLGRAQRFPDYWEIYKNESAVSVSALGTRPETTTQLDLGALGRRGPFEFSLSGFAAAIDDYILVQSGVVKPSGMMGTRSAVITRNVSARSRGGEASAAWHVTSTWKLDAAVSAVHADNRTDHRPLAQQPPLESRIGLAYTQPAWSAGALIRAAARQDRVAVNQGNIVGQDLGPTAAFTVVSLHGSWRPTAHLRVSAGVDNLFDELYAEHLSRAGAAVSGFVQTTRVNEPGRTLWLKLDTTF